MFSASPVLFPYVSQPETPKPKVGVFLLPKPTPDLSEPAVGDPSGHSQQCLRGFKVGQHLTNENCYQEKPPRSPSLYGLRWGLTHILVNTVRCQAHLRDSAQTRGLTQARSCSGEKSRDA